MTDSPALSDRPTAGKVTDRERALMKAIAQHVGPLEKRVDELENVVRAMVEARARNG